MRTTHIFMCIAVLSAGCATVDQPVRTSTVTNVVKVPGAPIACLKIEEIPAIPVPTVIADKPTHKQKDAAVAGDLQDLHDWAKLVGPLLTRCAAP